MDVIPLSYGSLGFAMVFGKTLNLEHWRRNESRCLLAGRDSLSLQSIIRTLYNAHSLFL